MPPQLHRPPDRLSLPMLRSFLRANRLRCVPGPVRIGRIDEHFTSVIVPFASREVAEIVHCGDTRRTRRALVFPHIDQFHWMDLEVLDLNCLVLYLYLSSIIKDSASLFFALAILSKIENHYPNRVIG